MQSMPSYKTWMTVAGSVHEFVRVNVYKRVAVSKRHESAVDVVERLKSVSEVEYKFSSARCSQSLTHAKAVYLQNLPQQYSPLLHQQQVLLTPVRVT
jgi:hypothetical protein